MYASESWPTMELSENGKNGETIASERFRPIQSVNGCGVDLHDHFKSATAFLICSGPSLRDVDLSCLQTRGVLTCTVNNACTLFRSNLWVSYDNPGSFSDVIWRDPGVWKFVPVQRLDGKIRRRNEDGELEDTDETARQMPATFGFRTNRCFQASQWLSENSINCGDGEDEPDRDGPAQARSVMMVALRLLHYLGVRKVFLLGCDFRMSYGADNYAFQQARTRRSVRRNNQIYRTLSVRFEMLLPYFQEAGYDVFNCTPNSGLTVFPYVEFAEAVKIAKETMPTQIDTNGMYDRP